MAGSEGSDTGSIAQSSEGNSQGKLAISETVEVKVIWLILQETLEDLTAADLVIFDNFTSYLLFKKFDKPCFILYMHNTKQSNPKEQ